ncbi:MAG: LysR family transcriptional regulator [Lachnospiraceae bacterium]|nr:LysR family transcriptional regulator [Lachnospiraceae bacterium]MDD3616406.1 LysR family transcriptional regulator [Lachnospiraceae bacterium]
MDISFELYKVFYYVAAKLSFSEASKDLFISQSAVSQSIRTLEKKLGHPLFIRSTKKVQLTPEGELLLRHIEPAVHLILQGEQQLSQTPALSGQLRIGASDTICRYFLVPYLKRFHEEFPQVHIKVTNQTSLGCVELLENSQVDLIVVNSPNTRLKTIKNQLIINEFQDVFATNPRFFKPEKEPLTLEDLQKLPILMLNRRSTTSLFLHQLFEEHRLSLIPEVELSSNDLLIDFARIGLGVAFVPDYMLSENDKDLIPLKLKTPIPSRSLILAYSDQLPNTWAANEFIHYFLSDDKRDL